MTSGNDDDASSVDKPSPANVDLLKETRWIAETTGVVRRDKKTREWGPDLDLLGKKIGRTTGALKALRTGGDPELLTLRMLLAYAVEHIDGYNSVRFALVCGLLHQDHVLASAQELVATGGDAAAEPGALSAQTPEEEVSPEDLETALRVSRLAFGRLAARVRDRMRPRPEGSSERP